MTARDKQVRRDVIPRWRSFERQGQLHESTPLPSRTETVSLGDQVPASAMLDDFRAERAPLLAADALVNAIAQRNDEVIIEAAKSLSELNLSGFPELRRTVERALANAETPESVGKKTDESFDPEYFRRRIADQKFMVRTYPGSALGWLDLGLSYASIGQVLQAERAVGVAVALCPGHRAVKRAASRFFVHSGDPDRALHILSGHGAPEKDPWVLSAHIATSRAAGFQSELTRVGRRMLKEKKFPAVHLSELAAAVATSEIENGAVLHARKLAAEALLQPTENAVAQFAWLETVGGLDLNVSDAISRTPATWEARTFEDFEAGEWVDSCQQALCWLRDQPFSSRPAIHGSFVASTFLEDYELALRFAEAGMLANPDDAVVVNNYVVALAETGDVVKARSIFDATIRGRGGDWRETYLATGGLITYREGDMEKARELYRAAISSFVEKSDARGRILASIFQAREELRIGETERASMLITDSLTGLEKLQTPEMATLRLTAEKVVAVGRPTRPK